MFEDAAARALEALWSMRSPLNLLGSSLNMETRHWIDPSGGIGASSDSFYEYLIKAYVLLGEQAASLTLYFSALWGDREQKWGPMPVAGGILNTE